MSNTESKLAGLAKGDRFRITIEGTVVDSIDHAGDLWCSFDGDCPGYVWGKASFAPTFQIEKLEKPIEVGDRVRHKITGNDFEVVAMRGLNAILWNEDRTTASSSFIENLERV